MTRVHLIPRVLATACVMAIPCLALLGAESAQAHKEVIIHSLHQVDVHFPGKPKVSDQRVRSLTDLVERANAGGLYLRIAIIPTNNGMGRSRTYFGKPQEYAQFVKKNLRVPGDVVVIVVMPQGVGLAGAPVAQRVKARAGIPRQLAIGSSANALATAAETTVIQLAAARNVKIPAVTPGESKGLSKGVRSLIAAVGVAFVVFALLAIAAVIAAIAARDHGNRNGRH